MTASRFLPGRTETSSPCPSSDSTQMLPPCRSTIFLQIARPMPVPANSSRLCSRWNMPKILSKYCGSIPSPLSLHRKDPLRRAILRGGNVDLRGSRALVLDAHCRRGSETAEPAATRPPGRSGSGSCVTSCAAVLDRSAQIDERLLERLLARRVDQLLAFSADARIGQQILYQPLHAVGAVHRECDEVIGIGIELALVAPAPAAAYSSRPFAAAPADRAMRCRRTAPVRRSSDCSSATFCSRCASAVLRSLMSRMAAVTRMPSALSSGLSMISIGNSLPSLRRPVSSMPVPICCASASSDRAQAVGDQPFGEALRE